MTQPADLDLVEVPAEQIRTGDLLADDGDAVVRGVILDAVPEYVYAFTPEQRPYPRGQTVRVRRPRTHTAPAADPAELAAVRDLALALADQAATGATSTAATRKRVTDAAARVKGTK